MIIEKAKSSVAKFPPPTKEGLVDGVHSWIWKKNGHAMRLRVGVDEAMLNEYVKVATGMKGTRIVTGSLALCTTMAEHWLSQHYGSPAPQVPAASQGPRPGKAPAQGRTPLARA